MDGVRPVAAATREQRRAARKVLDGVDALLRSLEDEVGGGGEVARRAAPAVSFGRRLGSCGVAAAASRRVRASVTPGEWRRRRLRVRTARAADGGVRTL